jgi:hypothetical protein
LIDDPMDEDIPATGSDIGVLSAELTDPSSSHPPRAPVPKRIHLGDVGQAKPIRFVPSAVKVMSSFQACTSSSVSPRVLIFNDSFHMMLDFKAKYNKFPSTYDDMVAFLNEVHIQLLSHSFRLKRNDGDKLWRGPKEKAVSLFQLLISGLSPPEGLYVTSLLDLV